MEWIKIRVKSPFAILNTSFLRRIALGILLLSSLMSPNVAAAQPSYQPGLVLPDGQWTATAVTTGPITGEGFSGTITYDAAFTFSVTNGVVEGGWDMLGFSFYSGDGISGNGQFIINGVLEGSAGEPKLHQTGGEGTGTVMFANGTESSGSIPMSGDLNAPITLQEVTCDSAKGVFNIPADMAVASGGASSGLIATFDARRFTGIPSHDMNIYSGEVTALLLEGMDFNNIVASGGVMDISALHDMINRSEELYRELRLVNGCDRRNAGEFINSLQSTIAALIDTALAHPEQFTPADLQALINAALRTGLIGAGAADPDLASQYERDLIDELERRLDEGPDCVEAGGIFVAADMLGATGIMTAVQPDIDACGGG